MERACRHWLEVQRLSWFRKPAQAGCDRVHRWLRVSPLQRASRLDAAGRLLASGVCLLLILAACNLTPAQPTPAGSSSSTAGGRLVVAWADEGNLILWREGEEAPRRVASGAVVRPYVAPDGGHIAFTRGPQGTEESLWVVDAEGAAEQQLVDKTEIRSGGRPLIGQVAWLDEAVLYFNTLQAGGVGVTASDDLYRANVRTRQVSLILAPTEGGQFTVSPDRQQIAVVYAGTYGRQDGRIRVVDLLGQTEDNLLFFVGISTGSHYNFYPEVYWLPDSAALLVAVPDKDLVYDDVNASPATLWRLPVSAPGERAIIGSVDASFFGLPRWSESGENLLYARRVGDPTSNHFELALADADGANPVGFANDEVGRLQPAQWIAGTNRYFYAQGVPGTFWISAPGEPARRLPNEVETMFTPLFADPNTFVFASAPAEGGVELRYGRLDSLGAATTLIATVSDPNPLFDAVVGR